MTNTEAEINEALWRGWNRDRLMKAWKAAERAYKKPKRKEQKKDKPA